MKQFINKEIFRIEKKGYDSSFLFKDLPKDIQETDVIDIVREEGLQSENNSYDDYSVLIVIRKVLETELQYKVRLDDIKIRQDNMKKQRYENYLKLKKEFEN